MMSEGNEEGSWIADTSPKYRVDVQKVHWVKGYLSTYCLYELKEYKRNIKNKSLLYLYENVEV